MVAVEMQGMQPNRFSGKETNKKSSSSVDFPDKNVVQVFLQCRTYTFHALKYLGYFNQILVIRVISVVYMTHEVQGVLTFQIKLQLSNFSLLLNQELLQKAYKSAFLHGEVLCFLDLPLEEFFDCMGQVEMPEMQSNIGLLKKYTD